MARKGQFQKGNPGKPKGARNKVTKSMREAVLQVFQDIGGTPKMAAWAGDNLTEFYRIAGRLIPGETLKATVEDGPGGTKRVIFECYRGDGEPRE